MTAQIESRGDAPHEVVEFAMRRPRFWSPRFTVGFFLLAAMAAAWYAAVWPPSLERGPWSGLVLELLLPAAACGAALVMRWRLRPAVVPSVSFHDDHFLAPRHAEARRAVRLGYDEILAVDLRGLGRNEQLLIGTRHRLIALPRLAFLAPDSVERVLKELYLRILRLPQGTRIVEQIARRRKLSLAAMSRSATATHVILGLSMLVFGLELATGALSDPFGALRFGAGAPVLVKAGEVYRLLASVLVHASLVHLYFDGFAFFFLGSILERVLGHSRFLIVYLVAGLAGALAASALGARLFSANASAGTFGLLGAYLVVSRRLASDLPVGFRQPLRWWALMAAFNGALPLFVHEIDPVGLVAGLVAGMGTALLVMDGRDALDPARPARLSLRFTAGTLATLYAAAVPAALGRGTRGDSETGVRFARAVLADSASSPDTLHALAWKIATHPQATPEELDVAERASDEARERRPEDVAMLDGWAAVRYRLGDLGEAVDAGREVLRREPGAYHAEHLARYLRRYVQEHGAMSRGPVAAGAVRLSVTPAARDRYPQARLTVTSELPSATSVIAIAMSGGRTVGLVRARLPAGAPGERVLAADLRTSFPPGATYVVAVVDADCRACDGDPPLTFWNLEAQVRDLP